MQGNTRIDRIEQLDALDFVRGGGLLPVVAQHARTGEVLMLGYADREALGRTLQSGTLWFWSRSRERLWQKGETSGNVLRLVALHTDCDADALVALVEPAGPTCHTGRWSCFEAPPTLAALDRTLATRAAAPTEDSYTARLLGDRNLRLKKIGEEAAELAVACADQDTERAAEEAADLIYHALVACRALGVSADQVLERLATRMHRPAA
jgi:phosphoribosyl-ATP pyrophosphohydrolase/phosphoribosyl-AMP cyclohydrolase